VFEVCAGNGGSIFRSQRNFIPALIGKNVHFLLHNIRILSDGSGEQAGGLQNRSLDPLVARPVGRSLNLMTNVNPKGLVGWENILHAAEKLRLTFDFFWYRLFPGDWCFRWNSHKPPHHPRRNGLMNPRC